MASLDILCINLFNLKNKIMKIEHRKIFRGPSKILKNISWPPQKPSGAPSDILNVRSLTSSMSKLPRSQSDCFPLQEELKLGCVPK